MPTAADGPMEAPFLQNDAAHDGEKRSYSLGRVAHGYMYTKESLDEHVRMKRRAMLRKTKIVPSVLCSITIMEETSITTKSSGTVRPYRRVQFLMKSSILTLESSMIYAHMLHVHVHVHVADFRRAGWVQY